ncbi:MAG: radical SAM protein, partial [Bacteroidales bacterium]|nr:radical SAM protein [Bacteroidales bacterium]
MTKAGIYIHIPYCAKLCYYCDFHFSLNLKTREEFVSAVCEELRMRKDFVAAPVETLYFGGGTPSLLKVEELKTIFSVIRKNFVVWPQAEVSFECNPDDITEEYCNALRDLGINRLSIGIQSFFDDDLRALNRRHSAESARNAVKIAQKV